MKFKKGLLLVLSGVWISLPSFAMLPPQVIEEYYDIQGKTAQELREQMNAKRPMDHGHGFDADTHWYVHWHFNYKSDAPGCHLTKAVVHLKIVYQLPRWSNPEEGSAGLQKQWQNYQEHLRRHEQGHAENGERAANAIEALLNNLAPFSTCPLLDEMADERAEEIVSEHQAWDLQYDHDTQHGKTQGAIFP